MDTASRVRRVSVTAGGATSYAVGGSGQPVLFLHGWGLGHRTYARPLALLEARGYRVYAPSLPGFGGSETLPREDRSFSGYGAWAAEFLAAVGVTEPVVVVGHSFGGGVGVSLAHRQPELVRCLVLLNSVGGANWHHAMGRPGYLGGRPLWSWGLQLSRELLPVRRGAGLLAGMWLDVLGNLLANPAGFWEIGRMAATADLMDELQVLGGQGVPVLALRGHSDGVVPLSAFEAMCAAVGTEGRILRGSHSFLLTDPSSFDEVMANVLATATGGQ